MKPSKSCNILRSILRSIDSSLRTDADGVVVGENPLPCPYAAESGYVWKKQWLAYNVARKRVVKNVNLKAAAISRFYEVEKRNAAFNRMSGAFEPWVLTYLLRASQICASIIGDGPDMNEVFSNAAFTGGASTSRKRLVAHPALKWWAGPPLDVTPLALRHLLAFKAASNLIDAVWDSPDALHRESITEDARFYRVVPGSRFNTVPKDAKTDRTILIEPDGNMLLQRGAGVTIRKRLKRVGIDLQRQEHNQHLAYIGSCDNSVATVDLRDASNSLYKLLICLVVPPKWYDLLYDIRSHICKMPDGSWHVLEMISSMGNGYTFELESLLFYCLAKAVNEMEGTSDTRVSVYGDDIIIPGSNVPALYALFKELGLEVNTEKSYANGPFRESCGKHYFSGIEVTPFYFKEDATDSEMLRIVNSYHSWCTDGDFTIWPTEHKYRSTLEQLVAMIPMRYRNQVPLEYSNNCGLYSPLYTKPIRKKRNRRGYTVACFSYLRPKRVQKQKVLDELAWFYKFTNPMISSSIDFDSWKTTGNPVRLDVPRPVPLSLHSDGRLVMKTVSIPLTAGLIP